MVSKPLLLIGATTKSSGKYSFISIFIKIELEPWIKFPTSELIPYFFAVDEFSSINPVSYTHLTLPTKVEV